MLTVRYTIYMLSVQYSTGLEEAAHQPSLALLSLSVVVVVVVVVVPVLVSVLLPELVLVLLL